MKCGKEMVFSGEMYFGVNTEFVCPFVIVRAGDV